MAWLPTQLGLGPGDKVAYPRLAYPTYEVGARLARADHVAYDAEAFAADAEGTALDPTGIKLLWLNSPSNPTGRVLSKDELTRIVAWAREHGILVFSDECYIELGWEADPVSVLHPDVCGGSYEGIVSVHSLSKRSNLAGYRAAFLAGDAAVLGDLLQIRKHGGMMTSAPTQAAVVAALGDDDHVQEQRGATRPAARPCGTPWSSTASASSTARRASTCGPRATSPAGTPWRIWRSWGSWSRPATSTAPRATGSSAWR